MKQASQKVKNNKLSRHGNTYLLEITNTNYGWREDRSVAGVELLVVDFFQSQSGLPPGGAPPRTLWSELPRGDPNQRSPDRSRPEDWDFLFPPTVLTTKNYNGANDMSLRQNGQRAQSHSNGQRGVERGPQGGEELSSKTQTIQTMM